MNTQILLELRNIIDRHFMFRPNRLKYRQSLSKDLSMNQYELNEMLVYVEDEFKIQLNDKDVSRLHTVGDLVNVVRSHKQ